MRTLIYARLSRSQDNSTSLERQLAACRDLASQRGYTIAGEYVDDGVSGSIDPHKRPNMRPMLERLTEADVIVVWKLDRLARSFLGFADLLRDCEKHNVGLVSATEPLDTTSPMGRAMVQITSVFAELERAMITERIKASRAHLATTERHAGGRPPYGLRIVPAEDGHGKILKRDWEAVAVVRDIIERLTNGEAVSAIAKTLNDHGVPTPRVQTAINPNPKPSSWSYLGIVKILKHPSLLGHKLDTRGHVRRGEDGAAVEFWEPVCDAATRDRALAVYESRTFTKAAPSRRHWLFGVATCATCGRLLTQHRSSERAPHSLKCLNRHDHGVGIGEAALSDYVTTEILSRIGDAEAVEPVRVGGTDTRGEVEAVEKAIANLRDDRDAGLFDDDTADYRDRMKRLTMRRATLNDAPVEEPRTEWRGMGCTFRAYWERVEPVERGQLLRRLGVRAEVSPAYKRRSMPTRERVTLRGTMMESAMLEGLREGDEVYVSRL